MRMFEELMGKQDSSYKNIVFGVRSVKVLIVVLLLSFVTFGTLLLSLVGFTYD